MSALVTQRFQRLAGSLVELKAKVRAALATELASAIGLAVRDMLIVTLIDRLVAPARPAAPSRPGGWRDDEYDRTRDEWGEPKDPWADPDEYRSARPARRYEDDENPEPSRTVPVAAAVAVGVNVGRWWLSRKGSVASAIGLGTLATTLGLTGGPLAHVLITVVAAASDVLTAESALGRSDLS